MKSAIPPRVKYITKTEGRDYRFSGINRGHLTPSSERNRTPKDVYSTFLTTNVLPMHVANNVLGAWRRLEGYSLDLVNIYDKELYIIAGGAGYDPDTRPGNTPDLFVFNNVDPNDRNALLPPRQGGVFQYNPKVILTPAFTWKIIVPLEPGQGIQDITTTTPVIAVITPNRSALVNPDRLREYRLPETETYKNESGSILPQRIESADQWDSWQTWRVNVDYLEELLGSDFLSNVPEKIQSVIEKDNYRLPA